MKNYKIIVYVLDRNCPPCELMKTYVSEVCTLKGREHEIVQVTGYSEHPLIPIGLSQYPWTVLQNRDVSSNALVSITDESIIDNFYGADNSRLDLMMEL